MKAKGIILVLSVYLALALTSGGYGYWEKELTIEGNITVVKPQSDQQNMKREEAVIKNSQVTELNQENKIETTISVNNEESAQVEPIVPKDSEEQINEEQAPMNPNNELNEKVENIQSELTEETIGQPQDAVEMEK